MYSFYCIDKATPHIEDAFNNLSFLAGLAGNELADADLFLDSILESESKRLGITISRKGRQAAGKTLSRPFLHATLPSPPLIDHALLTVRMSGTSQGMTGLSASNRIMPAPPSKLLSDLDESL